jgi:hypothetical protein
LLRALLFVLLLPIACAPPVHTGWYAVTESVNDDGTWDGTSFIDLGRIQSPSPTVRRAWVEQHWDEWGDVYILSLFEFDCAAGTLREIHVNQYNGAGRSIQSREGNRTNYAVPSSRGDSWLRFVCEGGPRALPNATPVVYITPGQYVSDKKRELTSRDPH